MTNRIRAFLAFVYDFVIGDDWRMAAGVTAGLAVTYGVSRTSVASWWIVPLAVLVLIPYSLWRAVRPR